MKKIFFILFILPLPFLINATKNDLFKEGKTHIIKNNQMHSSRKEHIQNISCIETNTRKNLFFEERKTDNPSFFVPYCLNYEWQECVPTTLIPLSYCGSSWEDAYSWSLFMYQLNVDYLGDCPDPE